MAGGAGKRAKRGEMAEAEPIIAYDSDMCTAEFGELVECSFVEVSLYNFSPGQSSRAEVIMWYLDDDAQKFGTRIAKKSWPVGSVEPGEPIIAYDSDMFSEELGWPHQCARLQVTLYDFSPGESARICIKCRMFPDQDDDESEPVQNSAKSAEARAAFRALQRASYCKIGAQNIFGVDRSTIDSVVKGFESQLNDMDNDETVKPEEYDKIKEDMKSLATHYKTEAFGQ